MITNVRKIIDNKWLSTLELSRWQQVQLEFVSQVDSVILLDLYDEVDSLAQYNLYIGRHQDFTQDPICKVMIQPVPESGYAELVCESIFFVFYLDFF